MKSLTHLDAKAVGIGISNAILLHGTQTRTGLRLVASAERDGESPEAWVFFCLTAAQEAHAAVMDDPPMIPMSTIRAILVDSKTRAAGLEVGDDEGSVRYEPAIGKELEASAHSAAAFAFRACMPKLTGRRATQAFIACVAAAVQHSYMGGGEAKAMLYTAQLALSAWPSRSKHRRK